MAREKKKKFDLSGSGDITLGDLFDLSDANLPQGEVVVPKKHIEREKISRKSVSKIVLRRERKGRKGKTVTLVEGLEGNGKKMEEMARELRRDLGCGSHVEENVVVLQGDQVERGEGWFKKKGFKGVVRGN